MINEEIKNYLLNRFTELLIGEIEIDEEIENQIMDDYMDRILRRADTFLSDVKSATDDKVKMFIAECIKFDKNVYEKDISKRWISLYIPIVIRNINKYDRKIIEMVNGKDKEIIDESFLLEIKEYLGKNKALLIENGVQYFFDKKYYEIIEDIKYLCGERDEKNIRLPEVR